MNNTTFIPSNNFQQQPQFQRTMQSRIRDNSQERISTYSKSSTIRKFQIQNTPDAHEQMKKLPSTIFYDHQRSISLSRAKQTTNHIVQTKSVSNFKKMQGISFAPNNVDAENQFRQQAKSYDNVSIQSSVVQNIQADVIVSNTLALVTRVKKNSNDGRSFQQIEQNLKTLKNLFLQMKNDKQKLEEIVSIQKKRLQQLTYSKPSSYFMEKYETLYERFDVLRRKTGFNNQTKESTLPPNILKQQLIDQVKNFDEAQDFKSPRQSIKSEQEQKLVFENRQLKGQLDKLKKNNITIMNKLNEQLQDFENENIKNQELQKQIEKLKNNNKKILTEINSLVDLNYQKDQQLLKERKLKGIYLNQNMKLNKEIKIHLDKIIKNRGDNIELQNSLILSQQNLPAINSLKQIEDKYMKAQSLKNVNYNKNYNKNKFLDLQIKYQILLNQYIEIYQSNELDISKYQLQKSLLNPKQDTYKNIQFQNELLRKQLKNEQNINKNLQLKLQNLILQDVEFVLKIVQEYGSSMKDETYNEILLQKNNLKEQKEFLRTEEQDRFIQTLDQIDQELENRNFEDEGIKDLIQKQSKNLSQTSINNDDKENNKSIKDDDQNSKQTIGKDQNKTEQNTEQSQDESIEQEKVTSQKLSKDQNINQSLEQSIGKDQTQTESNKLQSQKNFNEKDINKNQEQFNDKESNQNSKQSIRKEQSQKQSNKEQSQDEQNKQEKITSQKISNEQEINYNSNQSIEKDHNKAEQNNSIKESQIKNIEQKQTQIELDNLYKEKIDYLRKDNEESWNQLKQLREKYFELENQIQKLKTKNKTYWQILENRNQQVSNLEKEYEEQANFILEENITDDQLKEEFNKEIKLLSESRDQYIKCFKMLEVNQQLNLYIKLFNFLVLFQKILKQQFQV